MTLGEGEGDAEMFDMRGDSTTGRLAATAVAYWITGGSTGRGTVAAGRAGVWLTAFGTTIEGLVGAGFVSFDSDMDNSERKDKKGRVRRYVGPKK